MSQFLGRLKSPTGVISTIALLFVGAVFCKLGLWQLSRADEKTSIVESYKEATELPPLTKLTSDVEASLYRRVELVGNFDASRPFLLDNKIVAGQAGFEVIVPFTLTGERAGNTATNDYVLVNLGWIGHNGNRQINLAAVDIPESPFRLNGMVVAPSKGFLLKESGADEDNTRWPFTLQFIDYETIAKKLDKMPVMNAVIVAAEGQVPGFTYNFKPVASGASKHIGYAFQWFAMLFSLVILYLYLMVFKKADE